jgi:hypothetical protein
VGTGRREAEGSRREIGWRREAFHPDGARRRRWTELAASAGDGWIRPWPCVFQKYP